MFSLSAEGFSCRCSMDVIYEGLGISKLQYLFKKDQNFSHRTLSDSPRVS
jgi:hypothetical protein